MEETKNTTFFSGKKEQHSLQYIKIPDVLWSQYITYLYHRFYVKHNIAVVCFIFLYLGYSLLVNFKIPEFFLYDLISRLAVVFIFIFLYIKFYIKQKNSYIFDLLICMMGIISYIQVLFVLHGQYNTNVAYELVLSCVPLVMLSVFIHSKFRYSLFLSLLSIVFVSFFFIQTSHKSLPTLLMVMSYSILPYFVCSLVLSWDNIQRSRTSFLKQHRFNEEKNILAEYNQDLLQQVYTDGLTQIGNKRLFESEANNIFLDARDLEIFSIAVIIVDIDYFKNYNDNYGHLAGDKILNIVSQQMKAVADLYHSDIYRFGGEEFIFLQKYTNKYEVINFARALLESVVQRNVQHNYRPDRKDYITVSLGGCCIDEQNFEDINAMVQVADKKLYQAKSEGRDTFVI